MLRALQVALDCNYALQRRFSCEPMPKAECAFLADIYAAWQRHNLDLLSSYLPAEFSHFINIPPEVYPLGGTRSGKDMALARLAGIFTEFVTQNLDFEQTSIGRSQVTMEVRTSCLHKPSGLWLRSTKSNVWTIESGWPVALSEFYDLGSFQAFVQAATRQASTRH